ncbi:MAG: hypothetical protein ACR65W_03915 [Methylocystis sp.]|uniref:hypothetical protein n=1 Tax=Methylocystis sp. TaxID=1911079 RepID=UPI003DA39023
MTKSAARPKRASGKSGRTFRPDRLPGLDLRSAAGQLYARHFRDLAREFPEGDHAAIRDLAALAAQLDQAQGEAIGSDDPKMRVRARSDALRLSRLVAKKRAVLSAAGPAPKTALDDILARHQEQA